MTTPDVGNDPQDSSKGQRYLLYCYEMHPMSDAAMHLMQWAQRLLKQGLVWEMVFRTQPTVRIILYHYAMHPMSDAAMHGKR